MAIARVVVVGQGSSSRMMDYNAPLNSCTFGKAQQESKLSSGLSILSAFYVKSIILKIEEGIPTGLGYINSYSKTSVKKFLNKETWCALKQEYTLQI